MNILILSGNLGRNTETKTTANDSKMSTNSLAVNKSRKDKNTGEWINETTWVNLVAFGYNAEKLERCQKGQRCVIQGSLEIREYEQDGVKKYFTSCIVDRIEAAKQDDGSVTSDEDDKSVTSDEDDKSALPF